MWQKLDLSDPWPQERVYHSADVCLHGAAQGMLIVYGGRDQNGQTCKEIWGLRKH